MGVSNRTIRYDLDAIEEILEEQDIKLIRKRGVGIYLNIDGQESVDDMLKFNCDYSKILSPDERQKFIIGELLSRDEPVKVKEFEILLGVSEGTVLSDLDVVEEWLNTKGLNLIRRQNFGIQIEESEEKWRAAVFDFLEDITDENKIQELVDNENNQLAAFFKDLLDLVDIQQLQHLKRIIREAEYELGFKFTDDTYSALVLHTTIALQRLLKGKEIFMDEQDLNNLKNKNEFEIARNIAKEIEKIFFIKMPESEIGYITLHLLGAKLFVNENINVDSCENIIDKDIIDLSQQMVRVASKILEVDLNRDEKLIYGLAFHLGSTLNRVKYGMSIKNEYLHDIKDKYPDLYNVAKIITSIIYCQLDNKIEESEIGYIALHLGAALTRKQWYRESHKRFKVILVCSSGIGTTSLLEENVKMHFPNIEILGSHTLDSIEKNKVEYSAADFLISTVPIGNCSIDTIVVNPLLKSKDIERIKMIINKKNKNSVRDGISSKDLVMKKPTDANLIIEKAIGDIVKNIPIENKEELNKELGDVLEKFLTKDNSNVLKYQYDVSAEFKFANLADDRFIRIIYSNKSLEECVDEGVDILYQNNKVSDVYGKKLINRIKDSYSFVALDNGYIVNGCMKDEILEDGISLIVIKDFEKEEILYVVFLLAVDTKEKYSYLLEKMIPVINGEGFRDALNGDSSVQIYGNLISMFG